MKNNEVKLTLQGLDCANCANKIEKRVNDLGDVKEAVLNFTSLTLTIEVNDEDKKDEVVTKTKEIILLKLYIFSFNIIPDKSVPKIGINKL